MATRPTRTSKRRKPTTTRGGARGARPTVRTTRLVAGRYRLAERLGEGGASVVHAATDVTSGRRVAVKILREGTASANPRVRREVAALRLLHIPGVVALVDEGVDRGVPFLVMEVVEGRPFPGTDRPTWDVIAPHVYALLETLARVHAADVVHRDLKPSNVLVGAHGHVTVLDFGISRGPALGGAVTTLGTLVGTPEYFAPEQILGRGADPRSDLYAVGVMLYEALAGRLPHESREFHRLLELKRTSAPPLHAAAPDVPRDVASVVDRLLAVDPLDRPQTAGEALRLLFGTEPLATAAVALPRLGSRSLLDRLVATALDGCAADVWGPVGSGRTRLLTDAADLLAAKGRRVLWMRPSPQPYGSVAALLGGLDDLRDATRAEAEAAIGARLRATLRLGVVLIADDVRRVDQWSAALLEESRSEGIVLRAFEHEVAGAFEVTPLDEEDLRPLFEGPDRVFHLQTDGARELWRRTGGLPGLVSAEIAAWVRAGLARRTAGKVSLPRESLDRLRGGLSVGGELLLRHGPRARSERLDEVLAWVALAWPHATPALIAKASAEPVWRVEPEIEALAADGLVRRVPDGRVQPLAIPHALEVWDEERRRAAHRALAAALPEGTTLRLRHFAAAGDAREVVREALAIAPGLIREGRASDAQIVLEQAHAAARAIRARECEADVLVAMAWAALSAVAVGPVDHVLYELGRARIRRDDIAQVRDLLRAAREALAGDAERALLLLAEIGPIEDPDLEMWRHAMRMRAGQRLPLEREDQVLADIERHWGEFARYPGAHANLCSWRALNFYRNNRDAEAARLHLEAASTGIRPAGAAASYVNAALAFQEVGDLASARRSAESAVRLARETRRPLYEAYALAILRSAAYRAAETAAPDPEFVSLVAVFDDLELQAWTALTEAAFSWRAGDCESARALALRAADSWQTMGGANRFLARALALACTRPADVAAAETLERDAAEMDTPTVSAQVLGLLAVATPDHAERLRAAARDAVGRASPAEPNQRWEVLSPGECVGDVPIRVGETAVPQARVGS